MTAKKRRIEFTYTYMDELDGRFFHKNKSKTKMR